MEIQTVLPTSPIKPIKIRRDDEQKKQQQQTPEETDQENKPKQKNNTDIQQHIDEMV